VFVGKGTIDVIKSKGAARRTNERAILKISDVELLAFASNAKLVAF
jgi:hypothetical protein